LNTFAFLPPPQSSSPPSIRRLFAPSLPLEPSKLPYGTVGKALLASSLHNHPRYYNRPSFLSVSDLLLPRAETYTGSPQLASPTAAGVSCTHITPCIAYFCPKISESSGLAPVSNPGSVVIKNLSSALLSVAQSIESAPIAPLSITSYYTT